MPVKQPCTIWINTHYASTKPADINTTKQNKNVCIFYGPLPRYGKLRVAHAPGMPGTFSPPLRFSVTHVPWCMPGSLTRGILWSPWRGKRSRHSLCMRDPQFQIFGKRPITYTVNAPHHFCLISACISLQFIILQSTNQQFNSFTLLFKMTNVLLFHRFFSYCLLDSLCPWFNIAGQAIDNTFNRDLHSGKGTSLNTLQDYSMLNISGFNTHVHRIRSYQSATLELIIHWLLQ